jgi:hypothetical protein
MLGCIMAVIPNKVYERLSKGVKKFQPILATAQSHDVVEANTSNIVKAILSDVFGYAAFTEIGAEFQIKGNFCDLAIKLDDDPKPKLLIEVKAIGLPLKEAYLKQAVHYAADEGVTWVVLTNGAAWRIYEVIFGKPIAQELICEFDLLEPKLKGRDQIESLFPLTKEGFKKGALRDLAEMKRAASRYNLAAIILSDYFLGTIRGQLKKLWPTTKIQKDQLRHLLVQEVLKLEVTEGEQAKEAQLKLAKKSKVKEKVKQDKQAPPSSGSPE